MLLALRGDRAGADAGEPHAHPFKAWLDTHADEEFLSGAREAIQRTEAAFEAASEEERAAATSAYLNAAVYEREFFDQADRRW